MPQGHASSGTRSRRRIPGCTVQLSPRCGCRWAHNLMTGSYSARVPKSSLEGVHKEFVHHIVEEEAED